jgi:hypothetical protein
MSKSAHSNETFFFCALSAHLSDRMLKLAHSNETFFLLYFVRPFDPHFWGNDLWYNSLRSEKTVNPSIRPADLIKLFFMGLLP